MNTFLNQMKRDSNIGYTENEITGEKGITMNARTAAEAQMRASSAPVMDFPTEDGKYNSSASARYETNN